MKTDVLLRDSLAHLWHLDQKNVAQSESDGRDVAPVTEQPGEDGQHKGHQQEYTLDDAGLGTQGLMSGD